MRLPKPELKNPNGNTSTTSTTTPRPRGGVVIVSLFLVILAVFLFRLASGSGLLPGQPGGPMDQFDYLMRRGLTDCFQFVGTLIKEGPEGAYEQTTGAFQSKVSPEIFAAYIKKYPAIKRILRDEARIPPGAVEVDGGESSKPLPSKIRWQGNLPTEDEVYRAVYLEMIVEDGVAKVDLIRIKKDTLPSS